MIIKPQSSPNWKEGILAVLLAFYVGETRRETLRQLSYLAAGLLLMNFVLVAGLLFALNIFGTGKHILIEKGRNSIIGIKGDAFEFREVSAKKVPFNRLYIVRFTDGGNSTKKLVLSESEWLLLEFALQDA